VVAFTTSILNAGALEEPTPEKNASLEWETYSVETNAFYLLVPGV